MSEQETTFENAYKGDRVYSPLLKSKNLDDKTNGEIVGLSEGIAYPIKVKPDIQLAGSIYFTVKGEYLTGGGQVLFWSNPIKEIPARPKRKVKKIGYFVFCPTSPNNLYPGRIGLIGTELYDNKEAALEQSSSQDYYKLKSIEFEVEE